MNLKLSQFKLKYLLFSLFLILNLNILFGTTAISNCQNVNNISDYYLTLNQSKIKLNFKLFVI